MTRINVTVDGVSYSDEVEPRTLSGPLPSRDPRQDRHGRRVRHEQLRRLHRAPRRHEREVVQRPRRPGRRPRGDDDRGARHGRRAAPGAAGLPRVPRPPVRLLHARHDHAGVRRPQGQPRPERAGDPRAVSRATSAAAPATTTSSRPCSRRPADAAARRRCRHDRHRGPAPTPRRPTPRSASRARRKEDQRLITGRTRWTDNIQLPGHAAPRHGAQPLRPRHASPAIDTDAAKAAPGVVAVFTGADIEDGQGVVANAWPITADQKTPDHLPVAVDHVACAGEIVAVVAARTRGRGPRRRRARRRRLRRAAGRPRPQGGRQGRGARPPRPRHQHVRLLAARLRPSRASGGDVDEAIAKARDDGIVIEREYRQQRLIPAFMEPRSTVVDPTGEQMTMWTSTQVPHILRFLIAATTGIPESKVRVIAPDVGGGFGGKLQTTPEEFATLAVARRLGKPCKYTETRSESLVSGHHGRDQWQKLTLAAEKDGTVTGLKVELLADLGAYVALVGGGVPVLGAWMFNSIYKFRAYQFNVPDGTHQQDVGRRLPRRRPPRGDLRHRAADGRARRRGRASTRSRSARRTGSRTTSSRSPRWRA